MTINEIAMNGSIKKPHFVLVPFLAQGHMIPMIDFARLLALNGVLVTVVTTPVNTARFKAIVDRANAAGLIIRLAELRFPCAEVGLPEGCENVDLIPNAQEYGAGFMEAVSLLREPLLRHLREQWPAPSCLVVDSCSPWAVDVARELGIPRFVFHSPSCFFLLAGRNASKVKPADPFEPFLVPDFPHELQVVKGQALQFFDYPGWEKLFAEIKAAEASADGLVINTFQELEAAYLDSYSKALGKKMWAVGPVCLVNKNLDDKFSRGDKITSVDEKFISSWLDERDPKSVIYVSCGSVAINSFSHLVEVGLGLESSSQAFLWVIKKVEMTPAVEAWLEEFEGRTRSRGLIVRGWAPQILILTHPSVGGFMTHSGWNSTLEAVTAGIPMVTWPHMVDQFLNEKFVVEVLRTGVALKPRILTMSISPEYEGLITREDVEKAVRKVCFGKPYALVVFVIGPAYPLELGLKEVNNDAHVAILGRTALSLASKKTKLYVISGNCNGVKLIKVEDEAENAAVNEDDNALEVGENETDNEGENVADVDENEADVGEEGDNEADVAENETDVEDIHFDDSDDESDNDHFGDYIDATVNKVAPICYKKINRNVIYQINTLNDKHTCSRVHNSKILNRKWVAQKIHMVMTINKAMTINKDMKLMGVVEEGLVPILEVYLCIEHRFCLRHIYSNLKKYYGEATVLRDTVMIAAKTTYVAECQRKMKELQLINMDAHNWLMEHEPKR
ncbi:hypothetical protein Cni_G05995 [Canna indica]|uniref:Glycosyltransferase N-terminal domain-containing protein n=1 Tax=Canna indica TaxID=4628 RepID=A0AAQ3JW69_9LILI|nr:hypothetical protein Cni_G05995 [Canna indica]